MGRKGMEIEKKGRKENKRTEKKRKYKGERENTGKKRIQRKKENSKRNLLMYVVFVSVLVGPCVCILLTVIRPR